MSALRGKADIMLMSAIGQKRTLENLENLCYQKSVMEQRGIPPLSDRDRVGDAVFRLLVTSDKKCACQKSLIGGKYL